MNQLTSPINIQDDPFEKIVRTSHVDPYEADSLFDEYFGTLLVPSQHIRVDHLQPAEVPHNQVHVAQSDICLLQKTDDLPCSETEFESSQSNKSSDEVRSKTEVNGAASQDNHGQEYPTHSSPSTNQYRTGVSFESRTKRTQSLRSKRDRKKTDGQRFRQRFRKSLFELDTALNAHLGHHKRSQIQIIDAATQLICSITRSKNRHF